MNKIQAGKVIMHKLLVYTRAKVWSFTSMSKV